MMEAICRVRVEDGWVVGSVGPPPYGGKFRIDPERGRGAVANDMRRLANTVCRKFAESDAPTGSTLRFEADLPDWPTLAADLDGRAYRLTADLAPNGRRRVQRIEEALA